MLIDNLVYFGKVTPQTVTGLDISREMPGTGEWSLLPPWCTVSDKVTY